MSDKGGIIKEIEEYHFKRFDKDSPFNEKEEEQFTTEGLRLPMKRGFETDSFVKSRQDFKMELDKKIESKVGTIRDGAFKQGYEAGIQEGREYFKEEVERLKAAVDEVVYNKEEILREHKMDIYHLVKHLAKWVVLRELKDDDDYTRRLVEKLLYENQTSQKILVKIAREQFEKAPEILEMIKVRMGESNNIRVEVCDDIHDKGVVVDSENMIIKATLREQLAVLDQIFESVGLTDEHSREAA